MANKPGHVVDKTGADGWVYKDGKFYNSDADLAYLEIDGRPATLAQEEHFNRLVKKHYDDLYRKAGYKGTPSSPVQHGMHHHYPDAYGQVVNGHLVDMDKLSKVGHPGDVFALKFEDGRMSGFHKSRWQMHNMLLESEKRFMSATGMRCREWTRYPPDVRLGQGSGESRQGFHAGSLTGNPNFHQTMNPLFLPSFVVSLETTPTNLPRGEAPNGPFVPLLAARETKKNAYAMRISAFSADAPNE
jgi:hypothetical protein